MYIAFRGPSQLLELTKQHQNIMPTQEGTIKEHTQYSLDWEGWQFAVLVFVGKLSVRHDP